MNENKVPCGGFRIGDGLAMEGDTLKSLGGVYIKVKVNFNEGGQTVEFMDDSPLKTFEEISQKAQTSVVTLLMFYPNGVFSCFFNDYYSGEKDLISFCSLHVTIENSLTVEKISIDSNNKITLSRSECTLTPTT